MGEQIYIPAPGSPEQLKLEEKRRKQRFETLRQAFLTETYKPFQEAIDSLAASDFDFAITVEDAIKALLPEAEAPFDDSLSGRIYQCNDESSAYYGDQYGVMAIQDKRQRIRRDIEATIPQLFADADKRIPDNFMVALLQALGFKRSR
jgi:hypothetical protein